MTGFGLVEAQTELAGLGDCGSSALTGGIGSFRSDLTLTGGEVNGRVWSGAVGVAV